MVDCKLGSSSGVAMVDILEVVVGSFMQGVIEEVAYTEEVHLVAYTEVVIEEVAYTEVAALVATEDGIKARCLLDHHLVGIVEVVDRPCLVHLGLHQDEGYMLMVQQV